MKGRKIMFISILTVFAGCLCSCKEEIKDEESKNVELELGVYAQTYPETGHSHIKFLDRENLIVQDWDICYENSLEYRITEETIELSNSAGSSSHYFRAINSTKFEIGNIIYGEFLSLDSPRIIMTFEKINF